MKIVNDGLRTSTLLEGDSRPVANQVVVRGEVPVPRQNLSEGLMVMEMVSESDREHQKGIIVCADTRS